MSPKLTISFSDSRSSKNKKSINVKISPEEKTLESCENLYWFPQYLSEVCPFRSPYTIEWKQYLLRKNSEAIRNSIDSKKRFTFYTPKIVQSIFNVCKVLRQPPEVRYIAVDIFDRFLVEHFSKVSQAFEEMQDEDSETWQAIIERILKQSPLRILTSVQLAMKYAWRCNIITTTDIQEMLKFLGLKEHYPKRSILKSEARIYRHLNYNIPSKTPLTYLEMYFDYFQKREFLDMRISLHNFFVRCICVLDVAIIYHRQIYSSLAESKYKTPEFIPKSDSSNFTVSMKANYVTLAASVIFTSLILEDASMSTSKTFLRMLCSVGECKKSDVQELGKELINIVLVLKC